MSLYKGRQDWLRPWPEGLTPTCNEIAARALIVHEGRVLLAYEDGNDTWFTPGGRIAPGESLLLGLGREVEEETNLAIKTGDLLCFFDVLVAKQRSHKFEFIFAASPVEAPGWVERDHIDGDMSESPVTKLRWFTPEEAAVLPNVFPAFIRNWPALLSARPRAYYGTRNEENAPTGFSVNKFYISSRLVAIHDNRLLMVYNSRGKYWYGAGGRIELGELLTDTAARELQEETGLKGEAGDVIAVDEFFSSTFNHHQINLYTTCTLAHGNLPPGWTDTAGPGHVDGCAFHSRVELAALPRAYPAYMAELAWPEKSNATNTSPPRRLGS